MRKILVIIMLSLVLVGCSYSGVANHDPDTLKISFISSVPLDYTDAIEDYVSDILADEIDAGLEVKVSLTMPNFDVLTIAIMEREADMFVIDGWLIPPLLDPHGLIQLDQFYDQVDPAVRSTYITENEEGTDEHLYLVPLNEGSTFLEDTGFIVEDGLATGIVSSTPHQDAALKIIEKWL